MRTSIFILLQTIMTTCISWGGQSRDPAEVFTDYHIDAISGATHLCQQRVYGSEREIIWDALALSSTPADAVAFYQKHLGKAAFTQEGKGGTWKLPAGDPNPEWVITVSTVEAKGPHLQCEQPIPSGTRSILLLSHMMRKTK